MMAKMRAASCFTGIGGAEAAGENAEWLWAAEIERAPSQILATRFPETHNLGDVLADDFIERAAAFGHLDLLCGGPPCQAFSVAGLRKGMSDPRGQLSIRFVEILHAIQPRNSLVENVPGWLNHPDNAFGCFLGAVVGADDALPAPDGGSWPRAGMVAGPRARVAWRVLDAQYFGLAQRRERVFAVVDFGNGADPASVLFEPNRGVGDPAAIRKEGQEFTTSIAPCLRGSGCGTERIGDSRGQDAIVAEIVRTFDRQSSVEYADGQVASTIAARDFKGATDLVAHTMRAEGFDVSDGVIVRGVAMAPVAVAGAICKDSFTGGMGGRPDGAAAGHFVPVSYRTSGNCGAWETGDRTDALTTGMDQNQHVIAMRASEAEGVSVQSGWAVRRLTPAECEKLQGFPVGHTLIETRKRRTITAADAAYLTTHGAHVWHDKAGRYKTKSLADGPRFKALGNAWAVNCARWIIERIAEEQIRLGPPMRKQRVATGTARAGRA